MKKQICLFLSFWLTGLFTVYAGPKGNLNFIENKNQWDKDIRFKTDLSGGHIYFTNNSFRFVYFDPSDLEEVHELKHEQPATAYESKIDCYAYSVDFIGANREVLISPAGKKKYYHNYFLGNDPSRWAGNVGVFESLQYPNIYPGIDLIAHSEENSFKYDLIVRPGSDHSVIRLHYTGIKPQLLANGNLQLNLGFNQVEELAPYCYQIIQGVKKEVKSKYTLSSNGDLTFEFPQGYQKEYELVIDPTLVFATYSSSTATTFGFSATYDLSGSLYAGGECFGVGWPASTGAFQTNFGSGVDAGINKYDPNGTTIIYSTYYGGSGSDLPNNMVVNTMNELAITGSTSSSNLPVTAGCYDNALGGNSDAYVAHFNATGTALIGATYMGGSGIDAQNIFSISPNYGDGNRGEIFFDSNNDIVVAVSTQSSDFPVTAGAYQSVFNGGTQDGCVFKVNTTCTNLLFSTFLGGSGDDACFSIAPNSAGNWTVCGGTNSSNFPTTAGAYQTGAGGGTDGFVSILSANGTALLNSSFIGTAGFDHAFKIQVDPNDTVYVCGQTNGAAFPVSPGVYTNPGSTIFMQKYTPNLSQLALSTRIGQTTNLVPTAFLKDNCGNVYFSGFQANGTLPLTPNAYQSTAGGFWLCVLSGDFTQLVYATYMGAVGDHVDGGTSRFDPQGIVYQSVCTISNTQYQSPGCVSPSNLAASWDVASFKFNFELSGVEAGLVISPNDSGCAPYTVSFTNTSVAGLNYFWDFGDGGTSTLIAPTHTYLTSGLFQVRLIATNPNGCITTDTAYSSIYIYPSVNAAFTYDRILDCIDDTVHFYLVDSNQPNNVLFSWDFGDGTGSTLHNPSHTYYNQNIYTVTCIASNGYCQDTMQTVIDLIHPIAANFSVGPNDSICLGTNMVASSVSTPLLYLTHDWDWGDGTKTTGNPSGHMYTASGNYILTLVVTDTIGCHDTSTLAVFVDDPAYVDFTISDDHVCVGDPVFFKDTMAPYTQSFTWDFGDGTMKDNEHNPVHSWDQPNTAGYNVSLTGRYLICPPMTVTKTVIVDDYPVVYLGPDTSICPGLTGSIILTDVNNPTATYVWSTGETSPSITVTQPGYYWVKASTGACSATDSTWVKRDCYLNIPNSFSPNGDGLNDFFIPRELLSSGLSSFHMNIFNRWGELVFTTDNIDGRGWDGKFNGVPQPMGVFVYVIEAQFINQVRKNYSGNVTLIR
ncbi:MAG: PKD domain-containing protein [Chitinophagaceae bacterium]|nr:PKD domain-containing protein [Chitinophagaceae bacterium]